MRISDWSSDVCSSDLFRLKSTLLSVNYVKLDQPLNNGAHPINSVLFRRFAQQRLTVGGLRHYVPAPPRGDAPGRCGDRSSVGWSAGLWYQRSGVRTPSVAPFSHIIDPA